MGVDILGGPSWNWAGWQSLYDFGVRYGWEPAGTSPMCIEGPNLVPEDDPAEIAKWPGSYFYNEYQEVSCEDAENWADAIERGLADIREDSDRWEHDPKVQEFIRFLRRGDGFLIG